MTSLRHRATQVDPRSVLVIAGFAAWAAFVLVAWFGVTQLPLPRPVMLLVILAVPVLAVFGALLLETTVPALPVVAGAACALVVALFTIPQVASSPALALAIPALIIGSLATHRYPTQSLVAMFFLVGTYGSVQAFTGLPPGQIVDLILGGLWFGILGRIVIGRQPLHLRPTPAFWMIATFLVIMLVSVPLSQSTGIGLRSFRASGWHMSLILLVGYGAFQTRTLVGVQRAMGVIILLIAGYAALRWAIGHPSAREGKLIAVDPNGLQYDVVDGERKIIGSFPDGSELGAWMSCAIPFVVATIVGGRGSARLLALVTFPAATIGLLASNQRVAAFAVIAGSATVVLAHLISRGFRGPRLGVALAATACVFISTVAVYPSVINSPEKRKRYENILTLSEDTSYQDRLVKWRQVLADLHGEPFGFGLGSGDTALLPPRLIRLGADEIDNSYLKIAYEQGLTVMIFFIVTLFVLLFELLRHAVWTRAPGPAALTAGAAGTLVSMMVVFIGGIHIDSLASVTGWMIIGLGMAQYTSDRTELLQRGSEP